MTTDALRLIVANAQGLPGNVNRMMEATLTAGFARGDSLLNRQTVASTFGPHRRSRGPRNPVDFERLAPILSTVLLAAGVIVFLYRALA